MVVSTGPLTLRGEYGQRVGCGGEREKGGGYSGREGLGGLRGMGVRGEGVYYKLRGPLSLQGWRADIASCW